MKNILLLVFCLFFTNISIVRAEVTVLNQIIKAGQSWSVPEGKVLIVTHLIRADGTTLGPIGLSITVPGADTNEKGLINSHSPLSLQPLMAPFVGGTSFANAAGNIASVLLIGRLVDPADLFACIESEFQNVSADNEKLMAVLRPKVKRPARVRIEETEDLVAFETSSSAEVSRTGEGDFSVTVLADGAAKKFVQAKVQVRPN